MNLNKIKEILIDQPKFRLKQVYKAIYVDYITNWDDNTTLPKELKEKLSKEISLELQSEIHGSKNDQSLKAILTLEDNKRVETVLLKHADNRATVCVSSQVGCAMNCDFCATGMLGFSRNLHYYEILDQVLLWNRYLVNSGDKIKRVTNVVYMGMGEPLLNYENVLHSVEMLNDKDIFNIGARKISISTCGIIDGIQKLSNEHLQINLAISLHAPNDELRSELMPVNKQYPITKLLDEVDKYIDKKNRQVMFEYLLIEGVNDTTEHANELAELMTHPLYVVNLIRYNRTGKYNPSKSQNLINFRQLLEEKGVKVTQRHSFGGDIKAACGQLALNS